MKSIRTFICAAALGALAAPAAANCPGPGCPSGFVGGLLGGATAGAVAPIILQQKSTTTTKRSSSAAQSAKPTPSTTTTTKRVQKITPEADTRAQNRAVQEALNRRGFNAGTVDGVVGRRTRAAIASFQESLGDAPTGVLTEAQQETLLGGS